MISAVKAGVFSFDTEIKLSTPGGKPASWKSSTTVAWPLGLSSELFKTVVFPQIIGTAMARRDKTNVAFHGAIPNLIKI